MLINDVAEKYNVTLRTLRYYEEMGLIKLSRNESNIRVFDSLAIENLEKILVLKAMGFSLKKIKEIFSSGDAILKSTIGMQMSLIEEETSRLNDQKRLLEAVLKAYDSKTSYILDYLIKEKIFFSDYQERWLFMSTSSDYMIEIGEGIIPYCNEEDQGSLIQKIKNLRLELASDDIHIEKIILRDNPDLLKSMEFRIGKKDIEIVKMDLENQEAPVEVIVDELRKIIKNED